MALLKVVEAALPGEESWRAACPEPYSFLLIPKGSLTTEAHREIALLLDAPFGNFAFQTTLEGVPLLCGIFYDEKTVRFCSPGLRRELLAVSLLEDEDKKQDIEIFTGKFTSLDPDAAPSEHQIATLRGRLPKLLKGSDQDYRYGDTVKAMDPLLDRLLSFIDEYSPSFFERISNHILDMTTSYEPIRIHLLKFVAMLPSLDHDQSGREVKRMLIESLRRLRLEPSKSVPTFYSLLFGTVERIAHLTPPKPVGVLTRLTVRAAAKRFIAGEDIRQADNAISSLAKTKRDATLDRLGELVVSKKEADGYLGEVIKLIEGLSHHHSQGERNQAGINRAHVSIKVSALCSDFKPHAFEYTYADTAPRLSSILTAAYRKQVFIQIDAEHYFHRDTVWSIYKNVLLKTPELKNYADTGIVLQAYLRDAHQHLADIEAFCQKRNLLMPIRLVKGAYWDAETIEADAHGFEAPEFLNKEETDLNFRQLALKILENTKLQLCPASHNLSDHVFCEVLRERHFPDSPPLEHQCLHMTYEALSIGMAKMGWTVRNYVPVGPLIVGMSYLARRIMENSSQVGILTAMRSHDTAAPPLPEGIHAEKIGQRRLHRDPTRKGFTESFANHPPVRLYAARELQAVQKALDHFALDSLGLNYPHLEALHGIQRRILCPSDTGICVGTTTFASIEDIDRIVSMAHQSYNESSWPLPSSWKTRVQVLLEAASILSTERLRLASLIVYESAKSVPEALGDVDEAIDFLDFYAREEKRLQLSRSRASRGSVASVSPWNFPLAIPCGIVAAPLVAGNTVIFKSAEQSPLTACALVDILHRAGVPQDILFHLPGGGDTGKALVSDERIAMVVFTGSKAVGLEILHTTNRRTYPNKRTGKTYLASSIVETGGKNGIIVTDNAELDESVDGILYSAFAHAGQKCSACSRIIVAKSIAQRLISRLKNAVEDINVGQAWDFATTINPLITREDKERIRRQARQCTAEALGHAGRVLVDRTGEDLPGYLVGPALFQLPSKRAFEAESFLRREIFGPLLCLTTYESLEEAVKIFNANDYALTGGIFSQSQDDIDFLSAKMEAGNIYVNRSITGARVSVEPFGGFKLSGTGPKAGGFHYVKAFHHCIDPLVGQHTEEKIEEKEPIPMANSKRKTSCPTGKLLKALELISQGLGEPYQDVLFYYGWASKYLEAFSKTREDNRPIAGQVSFNDYRLTEESTLLISYGDCPHTRILFYLFSALGLGIKVKAVTTTNGSHTTWTKIGTCLQSAGYSKNFFSVRQGDEKTIKDYLKSHHGETIIADGKIEDVEKLSAIIFDGQGMRRLLTAFDGPELTDIPSFARAFTKTRSFAINTMRHGVPIG